VVALKAGHRQFLGGGRAFAFRACNCPGPVRAAATHFASFSHGIFSCLQTKPKQVKKNRRVNHPKTDDKRNVDSARNQHPCNLKQFEPKGGPKTIQIKILAAFSFHGSFDL
jgi:hypothetical protein